MPTTEEIKKAAEKLRRKKQRKEARAAIIGKMGPFVRLGSCSMWNEGEPRVTLRFHCGHIKRVDRLAAYPTGSGEFFGTCTECTHPYSDDLYAEEMSPEERELARKTKAAALA